MPTRPAEVDEIIKSYTKNKVPNFFIHAKNKEEEQVENPTQSTMNRLANKIPDTRVSYCNTLGKFDYKMLISGKKIKEVDRERIIKAYDYWSSRYNFIPKVKLIAGKNDEDTYIMNTIRENILKDCNESAEYVADVLAEFYYTKRKNSSKKILWGCFGEQMKNNARKNLANAKPICPICGKRFNEKSNSQKCCSDICARELDIINKRNARKR